MVPLCSFPEQAHPLPPPPPTSPALILLQPSRGLGVAGLVGWVLEECGLETSLSEGREPASLASFPVAECSPRLQCGGEKGVAEGFWGDNWAAIRCSRRSCGCCLCLSPVTGLLCSRLLKTPKEEEGLHVTCHPSGAQGSVSGTVA